jgi:hypothetical protein
MKKPKLIVALCFMGMGIGVAQPPPPHPGGSGNQGAPIPQSILLIAITGAYACLSKSKKE